MLNYYFGLIKKYSSGFGFEFALFVFSPYIILLFCVPILYFISILELNIGGKGLFGELQNLLSLIGFFGVYFSGLMFILFILRLLNDWIDKKKFPIHAVVSFLLYSFIFLILIIYFL